MTMDGACPGGADIRERAEQMAATASIAGGAISVNAAMTYGQDFPQIIALSNGSFAAMWRDSNQSVGRANRPSSGSTVRVQVLAADRSLVGSEIVINAATENFQFNPAIAALSHGAFVVTWLDLRVGAGDVAGDALGFAIKAQVFAPDGTRVGKEILFNMETESCTG